MGQVMGARNHNLRLTNTPNAGPGGIEVLRDYTPEQWRELVDTTKHRSDAVLAYDMVMTYSGSGTGHGWNPNPQELEAWKQKNMQWLSDTFGPENVRVAALHMDETTPHIQAIVTPIETKTNKKGVEITSFNACKWTGAKNALRVLQDSYAKVMQAFGLQRGLEKSRATHTDIKGYYSRVNADVPDKERKPRLVQERGLLGTKEREETAREYIGRNRDLLSKGLEYPALKTRHSELQKSLAERNAETDRLRDIDLIEVMARLGYEPDRNDSDTSRAVYHLEHDKISVQGPKFASLYEMGQGGGGAIDLVMHVKGCKFQEALSLLKTEFGDEAAARSFRRKWVDSADQQIAQVPKRKLRAWVPEFDDSRMEGVRTYLTTKRGIRPELIEIMEKDGVLRANSYGSAVFLHRDPDGKYTGCTVRATRGDFKQSLGDKRGAWFQIGDNLREASTVVLTESPIDALSYAQLKPMSEPTCIVSLAGHTLPDELAEHLKGKRIVIAFDNPVHEASPAAAKAGKDAIQKIKDLNPFAREDLPKDAKDWNEIVARRWKAEQEDKRRVLEYEREQAASGYRPQGPSRGPGPRRPGERGPGW